ALPFDNCAFSDARLRPAVEVRIEIFDTLGGDLRLFVISRFVIDPDLHWRSLSHKKAQKAQPQHMAKPVSEECLSLWERVARSAGVRVDCLRLRAGVSLGSVRTAG